VGKVEPVAFEDNEKSFPELLERIEKTVRFLEGVKVCFPFLFLSFLDRVWRGGGERGRANGEQEDDINKNEDTEVVLKTGGGEKKFSAKSKFSLSEIVEWGV